jgi:hypothetical protein
MELNWQLPGAPNFDSAGLQGEQFGSPGQPPFGVESAEPSFIYSLIIKAFLTSIWCLVKFETKTGVEIRAN